eukprot:CAMPEP_0197177244 /NCGR_PEP_ID=MMETSP1423-20130617/2924_1 /TAXON_ID=476441 /ORGANISM="Pseudo-nitzschia heimii, Strain UNC1101" /LENGTH=307 /DNA_ID=CAMNT_0042626767 /DNA_START=215 /DNA_END=1138 /DNA_ORIENTATION=-
MPIENNRKRTTSCDTNKHRNTVVSKNTSINQNTTNSLLPGHNLTISALVSTASSSGCGSKKRRRTSLLSSSFDGSNIDTMQLIRNINPTDYARAGFKANGFDDLEAILRNSESRFLPPTATMLEAYNTEILDAVRCNSLERVQKLYREGRHQHGCNACNRFGESILHIACRRGQLEMVRFLVEEVGLSCVTIRDDYHRTPLHDAFWTATANPDLIAFLMELPYVTELLLCKDKRGFTPLDYSRGEDRGNWLRFLWERRSKLRPTAVCDFDDDDDEIRRSDFATKPEDVDGFDQPKQIISNKRIRLVG